MRKHTMLSLLSCSALLLTACTTVKTTEEPDTSSNDASVVVEPTPRIVNGLVEHIDGPESQAKFIALADAESARLAWPNNKAVSGLELWRVVGPAQFKIMTTPEGTQSIMQFHNMCAWAIQLVDHKDDAAAVAAAEPGYNAVVEKLNYHPHGPAYLQDLKLGDASSLQEFVSANDCRTDYSRVPDLDSVVVHDGE